MKKIVQSVFLTACFFSMSFLQVQADPDLVLYLPFSGNANDLSGRSNNGTLHGGITLAAGRAGTANTAYSFDGVDDYISVANDSSLNPARISLCAWIKAEDIASHFPEIIRKSNASDATGEQYYLRLTSTSYPEAAVKVTPSGGTPNCSYDAGVTWNKCTSTTSSSLSAWHFVVSTYDGVTVKIYIDGVLVKSTAATTAGNIRYCGSELRIGYGWSDYPGYYKGLMDEVRIYRRALTACEVAQLYNGIELNYMETTYGLVMYLPFSGNANDASGNLNNGTVYGATLTTGVSGITNTAYQFDGVDDYISVPNSTSLNPDYISLCAWLKAEDVPLHFPEIFRKSTYSDASNEQYYLRLTNVNYPQTAIKNGSGCGSASWNTGTSTTAVPLSTWHFVVSTYDGTTIKIYIDGVLVNSTLSATTGPIRKCGAELRIGRAWSGYPNYYKGKMDELRIYNRALLDCEIMQLYNSQTIVSSRIAFTDTDVTEYATDLNASVNFYPNPFTNTIEVMGEINKSYTYQLYTSEGVKVGSGLLNAKIETGTLLPGIYIIQVYDTQNACIQTKRLVKL